MGEDENLISQYQADTVRKLLSPESPDENEVGDWLVDTAWAHIPTLLTGLLVDCVRVADNSQAMQRVISTFANRIGLEKTREILRQQAASDAAFAKRLPLVDSALGIKTSASVTKLSDLYGGIVEDFANYMPNKQVNDFEIDLIFSETTTDQKVLDIGFGAGRLLIPLRQKGLNVYGIDEAKGFAEYARTHDPDSRIALASWYNMPFKAKSFGRAYCLGRSYLHNTSVDNGIRFLEEAGRILIDEGELYIDLPKIDEGHYLTETEKAAKGLDKAGVVNREIGFINDSPNERDYFDRLVLEEEQFISQARLAGFEAEKITEKVYTDDEGHTNTNIYWKLRKSKKPLTLEEIFKLHDQAYTSRIPIEQFLNKI